MEDVQIHVPIDVTVRVQSNVEALVQIHACILENVTTAQIYVKVLVKVLVLIHATIHANLHQKGKTQYNSNGKLNQ